MTVTRESTRESSRMFFIASHEWFSQVPRPSCEPDHEWLHLVTCVIQKFLLGSNHGSSFRWQNCGKVNEKMIKSEMVLGAMIPKSCKVLIGWPWSLPISLNISNSDNPHFLLSCQPFAEILMSSMTVMTRERNLLLSIRIWLWVCWRFLREATMKKKSQSYGHFP